MTAITTIRWSPSGKNFWPFDLNYPPENIPADVIEVPLTDYDAAMARPAGSTFDFINGALVISAPLPPTPQQLWAVYQAQAMAALDKSDLTILRCAENTIVVPAAWAAYRAALRAIISATTGDPTQALPTRPAYPAGT